MTFENINFTFTTNYFVLAILILFVVGYSYFIYRHTIPQTSTILKTVLIILRSLALALIIIILFEPAITLDYVTREEPTNLLLVDNSTSIINKDSSSRSEKIHNFIRDYKNNTPGNIIVSTFGETTTPIDFNKGTNLRFNGTITNFERITPFVKKQKNKIATITILSDGIITDGSSSTAEFEKLNIPIFTISVGDTTKPSDVAIKKIEFNKLIYRNSTTEISAIISNNNFANRTVTVSLHGKYGVVEQKQIKLNPSGINNISFSYEPKEIGKQSLSLVVSKIKSEERYANNKYPFVVDVLNDKMVVLLIAGAPSADLSVLITSLNGNKKIQLDKIIQISRANLLGKHNFARKIDSADIIMMMDFPTRETPPPLLKAVRNNLNKMHTPYFLFLSEQTDYKKMLTLKNKLSFNTKGITNRHPLIYPEITSTGSGIFSNITNWGSLPPIKMGISNITNNSETVLLAIGKNKNGNTIAPLIFSSKIASSRNIVFNGINFWKWKIQSENRLGNLFDLFINNSIQWLSTKKEKRIFVRPVKDVFTMNESVEFIGNIYDETLTPINNASVKVEISFKNTKKSLILNPTKNGVYNGEIDINSSGTFTYKATITSSENNKVQLLHGEFVISEIEIEKENVVLNNEYLTLLSNSTGGTALNIHNYNNLFNKLKQLTDIKTEDKITSTKFDMWRNKWILIIIILIFVVEWAIRKQRGML